MINLNRKISLLVEDFDDDDNITMQSMVFVNDDDAHELKPVLRQMQQFLQHAGFNVAALYAECEYNGYTAQHSSEDEFDEEYEG